MIYQDSFNVEGGLYCSEDSLYYKYRRIFWLSKEPGDLKTYKAHRRALYRYRDQLVSYANRLENVGFSVQMKK